MRDFQAAYDMVAACAEGGATLVEFTNRGEGALPIFARLVEVFKKEQPKLILGVGSIQDAPTAVLYMMHGANYIVAPNFNLEVAKVCNRRKIPYIPGCATPTEIGMAEEAGAEIVKIFPPSPELIKVGPWSHALVTLDAGRRRRGQQRKRRKMAESWRGGPGRWKLPRHQECPG